MIYTESNFQNYADLTMQIPQHENFTWPEPQTK